jgi:hypothetical protein
MAIFGAGSKWDIEKKDEFFKKNHYEIGWNINDANDLYSMISTIKVGDIIYLKANQPGKLDIRIKGIGIVEKSLIEVLFDKEEDLSIRKSSFALPIKWIIQEEFKITIPSNIGKLTNVRPATLYEEYLPYVQTQILNKIFDKIV